jgi:hypothetical protein
MARMAHRRISIELGSYACGVGESTRRFLKVRFRIVVAVGTTIADRPPHGSVQARLRIRLLSWMSGGKAGIRIRMQNTGLRNPPAQERAETIPSHLGALTATD